MKNNELEIFKNQEFGEVRSLMIDEKPYFVGKDIAKCLGYSNPTKAISTHCKGGIKAKIPSRGGAQEMSVILEDDVYRLVSKARTLSEINKRRIIKILGLNNNKFVIQQRNEIKFLDKLEEALKPFNIKGIRQYSVFTYKIDYYIRELDIAIEYDENHHKQYTYEQHELRQKLIEKELECKFVRVSDNNSDEFNIGQVIKEIFEIKGVA